MLSAVTWASGAAAQAPVILPPAAEPRPLETPPPLPPLAPAPDLTPPERPAAPPLPDDIRFEVREVQFEGVTVFDAATLRSLSEPVVGRTISLAELNTLAERVEAHYRGAGYILSRAIVPPQRIRDGVVTIRVIEGFVNRIIVEGVDERLRRRIEGRLRPVIMERPAHLPTLERALLLAGDLPGVRASGVLRPSDVLGSAELVVTASTDAIDGIVGVSNRASPYAGPWTATGEVGFNSTFGRAERLSVRLDVTPDLREQRFAQVRYVEPVGDDGFLLGVETQYGLGESGHTLKPFDVRSRSWRSAVRGSYPLIRSRRETLMIDGGMGWQDSEVDVRHDPFSRDRYSFGDLRITYTEFGAFLSGGTTASLGVTQGLGIGGSNANDPLLSRSDAVPTFTKLGTELRRQQPLFGSWSTHALVLGQYSFNPLFSGEEFTLGGARVGRGYDPAEVTGWHGIGGAFELRYGEAAFDGWQGYGFYDRGRVWRNTAGVKESPHLESAGAGVRFVVFERLQGGIELARPLGQPPATADGQRPWKLYLDLSLPF